ncbi:MAG: hypothetical protein AB1540_13395 [Bdellovibrionota bacterium]
MTIRKLFTFALLMLIGTSAWANVLKLSKTIGFEPSGTFALMGKFPKSDNFVVGIDHGGHKTSRVSLRFFDRNGVDLKKFEREEEFVAYSIAWDKMYLFTASIGGYYQVGGKIPYARKALKAHTLYVLGEKGRVLSETPLPQTWLLPFAKTGHWQDSIEGRSNLFVSNGPYRLQSLNSGLFPVLLVDEIKSEIRFYDEKGKSRHVFETPQLIRSMTVVGEDTIVALWTNKEKKTSGYLFFNGRGELKGSHQATGAFDFRGVLEDGTILLQKYIFSEDGSLAERAEFFFVNPAGLIKHQLEVPFNRNYIYRPNGVSAGAFSTGSYILALGLRPEVYFIQPDGKVTKHVATAQGYREFGTNDIAMLGNDTVALEMGTRDVEKGGAQAFVFYFDHEGRFLKREDMRANQLMAIRPLGDQAVVYSVHNSDDNVGTGLLIAGGANHVLSTSSIETGLGFSGGLRDALPLKPGHTLLFTEKSIHWVNDQLHELGRFQTKHGVQAVQRAGDLLVVAEGNYCWGLHPCSASGKVRLNLLSIQDSQSIVSQ